MKSTICYVAVNVIFLLIIPVNAAQLIVKDSQENQVELLLSRLNLENIGLKKVKSAGNDMEKAAAELLAYYRSRTGVIHPEVPRDMPAESKDHYASPVNLEIADDALRNKLIATPNYPRHDFGKKIDWFTNCNPQGDAEWIMQLHRQYSWAHLGRAYRHSGDEKYAQAYCRQLSDWLENCPPSGGWPAWRVLEVGIRGHSWTCNFNYFLDSPHYTPRLLVQQLNSFYEHADLLTSDRDFSKRNWGLMEAEGVAFIGVIFPEFKDAAAWRKKGFSHLAGQINKQVLGDGMHMEMCFSYHSGSIHWLDRTRYLAELNGYVDGFPPDYTKTIERMYEVLARCAHPNGCHSMFGDDRPSAVTSKIRKGAEQFTANAHLKFLATNGEQGQAPPTTLALSTAGIYSLRSGWGENAIHLLMKCGRDGGWHCQPDNGTFELYAFGRYLMPDSGCYIYHGDKEGRQWFRQSRVHQTLTLDGADSDYKASLLLWKSAEDLDVVAVQNVSYENLTHRRTVLFVKKRFFILVDDAIGDAAGEVDLHFQLAPGKMAWDNTYPAVHTDFAEGGNVLVHAIAQPGMLMEQEQGQVSLIYSKKQARPAFRFRINKRADMNNLRFVTVIVPYEGSVPKVAVSTSGTNRQYSDGRVELKVSVDDFTGIAGFDLDTGKTWLR